jgi:uncharacterized membrane protein YkgB
MRHPFRKFGLVGGGVALSIALAIIAEWEWSIKTPGAYVNSVLFPKSSVGYVDVRLVLLLPIGVDSLLCFAVLSVAYLLFIKSSKREGK